MSHFIKSIFMLCLLACLALVISSPAFAGGVSTDAQGEAEKGGAASMEMEAESMEMGMEAAPGEAESMEMGMEAESMEMGYEDTMAEETMPVKDTDVSIYGRFWPRVTYEDAGTSSTDITDALSRVGIKASTQISDTFSAVLRGEWDVDIEANGDFGDARLAYVGLKSSKFGFLAIGKQWDPHYNVTAEVTDIFYHRASPFGYDNEGPFRSNNLVRYAYSVGSISLDAGIQINGSREDQGGDNFFRTNSDAGSAPDHADAFSVGASWRWGEFYIGASYLQQNMDDLPRDDPNYDLQKRFFGVGTSLNVTDYFYLAVTYQYIQDQFDSAINVVEDQSSYTLDVAAALSFGSGIKALAGFFTYDDDFVAGHIHNSKDENMNGSKKHLGYTVTLIKELHPSTDLFIEWVMHDYDQRATANTYSIGFRYDFDVAIF